MSIKEIVVILRANRDSYVINDDMKIIDPIILEENFEGIAKLINAIPCQKCKELEIQSSAMEESYVRKFDDLKAKLIECHNKNTELKGDISRGKSKV